MMVTAWNNGKHRDSGAGYGLKINIVDRDHFFEPTWETVTLHLEGNPEAIEINVAKKSFWGPTCRELINKEIGLWLRGNNLAPWPKSQPPKLRMKWLGKRSFQVLAEYELSNS